jgi:hypothetical protein
MFGILHFVAVKKPQHSSTLGAVGTMQQKDLALLPVGPTAHVLGV